MMKWVLVMFLFPAFVYAGEECAPMGGKCRAKCSGSEESAAGAFLDCSDKEECCIQKEKTGEKQEKTGIDQEKSGSALKPRSPH